MIPVKKHLGILLLLLAMVSVKAQKIDDDHIDQTNDSIFFFAEQMPEFPGGSEELYKWLGRRVRYPAFARENGVEGKVFVSFIVGSDGKIRDVAIEGKKRTGWGLEEEAIRVISSMPDWEPGKQNGKFVAVKYVVPISFTLGKPRRKK